jgi:hypothetical protein
MEEIGLPEKPNLVSEWMGYAPPVISAWDRFTSTMFPNIGYLYLAGPLKT